MSVANIRVLELVGQIVENENARAEYDPIMETFKEIDGRLRAELKDLMIEQGIKSTVPVDGKGAILSNTPTTTVLDPHAAMAWLEERNDLQRFMKLDTSLLIKEYGENVVPGVKTTRAPKLELRKMKEVL